MTPQEKNKRRAKIVRRWVVYQRRLRTPPLDAVDEIASAPDEDAEAAEDALMPEDLPEVPEDLLP